MHFPLESSRRPFGEMSTPLGKLIFFCCDTVLTRPNQAETAVHGCNSWLSIWTLSCRCPVKLLYVVISLASLQSALLAFPTFLAWSRTGRRGCGQTLSAGPCSQTSTFSRDCRSSFRNHNMEKRRAFINLCCLHVNISCGILIVFNKRD